MDTVPLRIASLLRCVVVSVIAFLLLSPLIKSERHDTQQPIIIIAQDNSQSIALCNDSAYYRTDYADKMHSTIAKLKENYEVACYTYGGRVVENETPDYSEHHTDINAAIAELQQLYYGRNIGAIVVCGDGIYNSGLNPATNISSSPFPIYTIAMGDTTPQCDAAITAVRHNRMAYIKTKAPVEVTLQGTELKGSKQTLTITHKGRKIASSEVVFSSNSFTTTLPINIDVGETPGLQTFTATLSPAAKETTTRNNVSSFSIEVIDGHINVGLLAAAAHPDVAALRRSIERNENYKATVAIGNEIDKVDLKELDIIVLHNLPSATREVDVSNKPALFIVGSQTSLARLNTLRRGVEINAKIDKNDDVTAIHNKDFANFALSEQAIKTIEQLPPLASPYGEYRCYGNTFALFNAQISTVKTDQPLVAFAQQHGLRSSFIFGEGLWRWSLYDYEANGTWDSFDELVAKTLTYTEQQNDKQRLHVETKNIYHEDEPIVITAQLYDDNYEPTNQPEATITIDGTKHTMGKTGDKATAGYRLTIPTLSSTDNDNTHHTHTYTATATYGGQTFSRSGSFVVETSNLEELTLCANHSLLNTIATSSGGVMLQARNIEQLPQTISQREDLKPIIHTHTTYSDLIALPWVFILILLLLTGEWVLRKYYGEL